MNANKILVVDCTDFNQTSQKNYKELDIHEVIPLTPITTFSRYEVLRGQTRRVHFDIDGVPENENVENLPDRFVHGWAKFMKDQGYISDENIPYVKTTNHNSPTHEGFSSHVICYTYSMDFRDLKNSIIMFVNTEAGKEFEPYVDTAIYSYLRLFKLPNFIGIPMNDINNYHALDPKDSDLTHYIIQHTEESRLLKAKFKVPRVLRKKAKKVSPISWKFYAQMAESLDELTRIFLDKLKTENNHPSDELTRMLNALISQKRLSAADRDRLSRYLPATPDKSAIIMSLCRLVKQKYRFTDEELEK